jgi:hypothetical protein
MNAIISQLQAKLNALFLLLHRFLFRWLSGRPVFLLVSQVPVNYGNSARHRLTDAKTIIRIQVKHDRITSFGRSSYSTIAANVAELRRLIGFTTQIQQR